MPNRSRRLHSRPISPAPVIALALLAAGIAFAQQQLPAQAPAPKPAPEAGQEAAAAGAEAPAGPAAEPAPVKPPASASGSPQRFEPTEKVRPDFDVAFPIDI